MNEYPGTIGRAGTWAPLILLIEIEFAGSTGVVRPILERNEAFVEQMRTFHDHEGEKIPSLSLDRDCDDAKTSPK